MYKYAGMSLLDYYKVRSVDRLRKQASLMRTGLHLVNGAKRVATNLTSRAGVGISNMGTKAAMGVAGKTGRFADTVRRAGVGAQRLGTRIAYNPKDALATAGLATGAAGAAAGAGYLLNKGIERQQQLDDMLKAYQSGQFGQRPQNAPNQGMVY